MHACPRPYNYKKETPPTNKARERSRHTQTNQTKTLGSLTDGFSLGPSQHNTTHTNTHTAPGPGVSLGLLVPAHRCYPEHCP